MTTTSRRVALLTDPAHPTLVADDAPLREAFTAAGWDAQPVQWRTPEDGFDLVVVRSCWDYVAHVGEFVTALEQWSRRARLVNPLETLRWNLDKHYLLELQQLGMPLPATAVVAADSPDSLAEVMSTLDADRVVVKPVIGAAGRATWLTAEPADPRWSSRGPGDWLVQQYLDEVVTEGEWSFVYFGGRYSHAALKRARPGEFRVQTDHGGTVATAVTPPAGVISQIDDWLQRVPVPWSYARVDGVMRAGTFMLMELELIEPELFFRGNVDHAARLVATVDRVLV